MKLIYVIISLFLILPTLSRAYDWESIGPVDIEANNFYVWGGGIVYEIICTSDGMLVNINTTWEEFNYGYLPIWDVEQVILATADLIAVMGNGSYSDGIYFFNFSNYEFMIIEYFINPRFIEYFIADSHFYVGGEQGLMKSETGISWEAVDFFNGKYCYDMVAYENNYVVSTDDGIYFSNDSGTNWFPANTLTYLSDLTFSSTGVLYGIFPGESWSSGLRSSIDYGNNWDVEFWSIKMSSVGFDCENNLFVGWEEANVDHEGIAVWTPDIEELTFFNDGLENTNINKITFHPMIDCNNILCCTDGGVYLLTDYFTIADQVIVPQSNIKLSNYPNPFNPSTTISFSIEQNVQDELLGLVIYNLKGQKVKDLSPSLCHPEFIEGRGEKQYSVIWNGTDENNQSVSSGIYFYKLKSANFEEAKKMILMK